MPTAASAGATENGSPSASLKPKERTRPHIWLYRRIGQMACFTVGPLFLYNSLSAYSSMQSALIGGMLLATGLVLRGQMIARFYRTRRVT